MNAPARVLSGRYIDLIDSSPRDIAVSEIGNKEEGGVEKRVDTSVNGYVESYPETN